MLAEAHDLPGVIDLLKQQIPAVSVEGVSVLTELAAATRNASPDLRLICFCTGVIVPRDVLNNLSGPAYNFHPGPPEFRGIYPAVFAIYSGARQFGATAHELSETVDEGAIVGVDMVDMPANIDRLNLEALSRHLVTGLLTRLAPELIGSDDPLQHTGVNWSGRKWTRRDFEDLCYLPDDVEGQEFERRYRALGEGPEHALKFRRFGRTFSLNPVAGDGVVYKGGDAVGRVSEE